MLNRDARHILVAEDDAKIRQGLVDLLESEGYRVSSAVDGIDAWEQYESGSWDLLLLDVMMPEQSGYDLCRRIRRIDSTVPIVMLTAKGEEIDKVVGLELGADDYITKPFGIHELLARIGAVLRRCAARESAAPAGPVAPAIPFTFGGARIDPETYRATVKERQAAISATEMRLIRFFLDRAGQVLDRDALLNGVWGVDYYGTTRTVDQHVAMLRKKIEPEPAQPIYLMTVHGVGYRYDPDGA